MTSSTKKTFLKYRVTYLEMEKRPSFAYPSLPVKSVVLLEVEKVPLWYFISIYREVGYKYEWTDILKQPKDIIRIEIRNFGIFEVKPTKAKPKARNPRTNEEIYVPPRKKVHYKPGKNIKKILDKDLG